jgi:uncharacterized iron-regulated protein
MLTQHHPGAEASVLLLVATLAATAAGGAAASSPHAPTPDALAATIRGHSVVLFGEVHDNPGQHSLRIAALKRLIDAGERPAIAFEQFDRERQADLDRARQERPRDADAVIAAGGAGKGWRWDFYRPYVQLALDHDLPIVAANLSRRDAFRVSQEGWAVLADPDAVAVLGLDRLSAEFVAAHEREIQRGHCDLLPTAMLPTLARAQIGRDLVLAQSIRPHAGRGVVLLTGNGHARKDIGVPFWLTPDERARTISIGMLEEGELPAAEALAEHYDAFVVTAPAERPDPCEELRRRFAPPVR